jgi:hypothetical protein
MGVVVGGTGLLTGSAWSPHAAAIDALASMTALSRRALITSDGIRRT